MPDTEAVELPELDLPDLDRMALLVVDVQQGFDDVGYWGPRNNPDCEDNIAVLLQTCHRDQPAR